MKNLIMMLHLPRDLLCNGLLFLQQDVVEPREFRGDGVRRGTPDQFVGGQLLLEAGVAPISTLDHRGPVDLFLPGQNQLDEVPEEVVLLLGSGRQGTLFLHRVRLLQAGQLDSEMRELRCE